MHTPRTHPACRTLFVDDSERQRTLVALLGDVAWSVAKVDLEHIESGNPVALDTVLCFGLANRSSKVARAPPCSTPTSLA